MSNNHSESSHYTLEQYLKIGASFSATKLGLLLIKRPLIMVEINKQANPNISNIQLIQDIFNRNGIRGFYKSTPMAVFRILFSESYRGPLMMGVPLYVEKYLKNTNFDHKISQTLVSVGLVSVIDSTLTCPSLRIVTHRLTSRDNQSIKTIANDYFKKNLVKEFYRGHSALFIQTFNLWGMFFVFDDISKTFIKKHCGGMSYGALTASSAMIAMLQTCINVIPDTIRVQMQKADNNAFTFNQTFQHIIKNYGRLALLNSIPHRFIGYWIGFLYKSALREYWSNKETYYTYGGGNENKKESSIGFFSKAPAEVPDSQFNISSASITNKSSKS